jgi:hypothetical protein
MTAKTRGPVRGATQWWTGAVLGTRPMRQEENA